MESKELGAEEVLGIIGEMCECGKCCDCPLEKIREPFKNCHQSIARNPKKVIKICKQWKADHAPIETEWAYICRIIEDKGDSKKCVYEEDITVKGTNPFDSNQKTADDVLKEYCKTYKGKFFAVVEHVCRVKGDG